MLEGTGPVRLLFTSQSRHPTCPPGVGSSAADPPLADVTWQGSSPNVDGMPPVSALRLSPRKRRFGRPAVVPRLSGSTPVSFAAVNFMLASSSSRGSIKSVTMRGMFWSNVDGKTPSKRFECRSKCCNVLPRATPRETGMCPTRLFAESTMAVTPVGGAAESCGPLVFHSCGRVRSVTRVQLTPYHGATGSHGLPPFIQFVARVHPVPFVCVYRSCSAATWSGGTTPTPWHDGLVPPGTDARVLCCCCIPWHRHCSCIRATAPDRATESSDTLPRGMASPAHTSPKLHVTVLVSTTLSVISPPRFVAKKSTCNVHVCDMIAVYHSRATRGKYIGVTARRCTTIRAVRHKRRPLQPPLPTVHQHEHPPLASISNSMRSDAYAFCGKSLSTRSGPPL
eukprot:m.109798 g.109798  ORF g.109798 m.109798 type:complete len:395 (+) comp16964_c0_seq18:248-1432(+)